MSYDPDQAIIYTDGSCLRNGQPDARAGIGVFWPDCPENNISEPIGGRQTNQRAEILAAVRGIEQAREYGYTSVLVMMDSKYVIKAAESWIPKWESEGWQDYVANKREFEHLMNAMYDFDVEFEWVPSSCNPADRLAKDGARNGQACRY